MARCRVAPLILAAALGLASAACGPSYTHRRLTQDLEALCLQEYHLPVRVQLVGHDVAVVCTIEHLLKPMGDGGVEYAPTEAARAQMADVVEAIHRVTLSADWPVNFYTVIALDPQVPGAWLMLVRYLDDVRRVNANVISPTEFFQRTVLNLQYDPRNPPDPQTLRVRDLTLEDFLVLQMGKRLQNAFRADPRFGGAYEVGGCMGEYRQGTFQFIVDMTPREAGQTSAADVEDIFDQALRLIATVLHDYRFERFEEVQLLHFPSGKTLDVPKTRLWSFIPSR